MEREIWMHFHIHNHFYLIDIPNIIRIRIYEYDFVFWPEMHECSCQTVQ